MSNIDKRPFRADCGDISTGRLKEIADNPYGDEEKCWLAKRVLALLDELEAAEKQLASWRSLAKQNIEEHEKAVAALDTARHRICELESKLTQNESWSLAAQKYIAELEERDKPKFVQCWSCKHDIEILAIADCDGYCPRCAAPIDLDDEPYAAAGKGE